MNDTESVRHQVPSTKSERACCAQPPNRLVRGWRSRRTTAIAATTAAVGTGLALNWGWLVAAGIAPLIIAVLPCLAMCALGLCASKVIGGAPVKVPPASGEAPSPQRPTWFTRFK